MKTLLTQKIKFSKYKNIVILTGAGISVASGLKTYRGKTSNQDNNIGNQAHVDRLKDNPLLIWQLFNPLRTACLSAKPNQAHQVLVHLEQSLKPEQNLALITQNVDRLHQKAGSKNVIELHGVVTETCYSNKQCQLLPFKDEKEYINKAPLCHQCNSPLKPNVVLFGESIPVDREWQVKKALRKCDLFIAIGTSGTVFPAANYVRSAEYSGAKTIFMNLEPMNPKNHYFQQEYIGEAEQLLPELFDI
ncbi:Transcriptional regulator, Sir2 family protein [Hyella patelloides LEGE 07179]|uniref:protein acetyllysine N-acetyltransferase n=1 Tax=Hyella patelloides LEGE 07179 TaxID=945734 RepID=A0A563VIK2_9CYAN|nr:Sir2 family NAD-dependent protein deacetylase [Hyella patelloides]VEP11276.1 Transcriptional regulator, Sir2 family protein [Hyella patelloides LEGE 07179]